MVTICIPLPHEGVRHEHSYEFSSSLEIHRLLCSHGSLSQGSIDK